MTLALPEFNLEFLKMLEDQGRQFNLKTGEIDDNVRYNYKKHVRRDYLETVYQMYISGNLYIRRWYKVLGFSSTNQMLSYLKTIGPTLNSNEIKKLYAAEINQTHKETCLRKFGVDNPSKLPEIKAKKAQTFASNFDTPEKLEEIRARYRETCMGKFGVDNPSKLPEIKAKKAQTFSKNFDSLEKLGSIREKFKETCVKIYGVENPSKSPEIKAKKARTFMQNFGVDNVFKTQEHIIANRNLRASKDVRYRRILDGDADMKFLFDNYCNSQAYINAHRLNLINRRKFLTEQAVTKLLKDLNIEMMKTRKLPWLINRDGNRMELDFYSESLGLAIEVNGLYNHSKDGRNSSFPEDFHYRKWKLCGDNGVMLLSFTCIEVLRFPEFVKDVIVAHAERRPFDTSAITPELCEAISLTADDIMRSANYSISSITDNVELRERTITLDGRRFRYTDCGVFI